MYIKKLTQTEIEDLKNPPTQDSYGFWGTLKLNEKLSDTETNKAWNCSFEIFQKAPWEPTDMAIRNFLRSRSGRHFADATISYSGRSLAERIAQASAETWVRTEFRNLKKQGFDKMLFEEI